MGKVYKVLGQVAPAASTATLLYAAPSTSGLATVCSSLCIVNRDTSGAVGTYSVQIVPVGDTPGTKHYIESQKPIDSRSSDTKIMGLTIPAGCGVYVTASSAYFSFSLFGCEITS